MAVKRHKVTPLTKRKRRQHLRRSQVKIGKHTIAVRKVVSQRGRTHPMQAPVPGMPLQPQKVLMDSTAIRRFKYTGHKRRVGYGTLRIWFVKGQVYDYANVPESVVLTLAQAQSKGSFFYYNIRLDYNYIRVR